MCLAWCRMAGCTAISPILKAAVAALAAAGVPVAIHAITDGRDVAPKCAEAFLADLQASLPQAARIATVIGRYWAMDRDKPMGARGTRVARDHAGRG